MRYNPQVKSSAVFRKLILHVGESVLIVNTPLLPVTWLWTSLSSLSLSLSLKASEQETAVTTKVNASPLWWVAFALTLFRNVFIYVCEKQIHY